MAIGQPVMGLPQFRQGKGTMENLLLNTVDAAKSSEAHGSQCEETLGAHFG